MKELTKPIFRSIMSALMVAGALALLMPLVGVEQSTKVLAYTFFALAVLLSVYEVSVGSKS